MLTKEEMPACPLAATAALIGRKWKLLIIRNLRVRPWRFNELKKDQRNGIIFRYHFCCSIYRKSAMPVS